MVKKANWLKNVKKAWLPDVKKLKHEAVEEETEISYPVLITRSRSSPPQFEVRVDEVNYEHNKKNKKKKNLSHPPSEEEEDSTPSSPEFVPPPAIPVGKTKEDAAAIFIQSTFRGHLARQEAKRMRRLARLKLLMEGWVVKRQAASTLKSMQTITRVQTQIRSRRIRMAEADKARHKQLLQKHDKEIRGSKNGGGNQKSSNQSKKQVEAGLLNKSEGTMKKERALAYASTHQQHLKSNVKPTITMFMDPKNLTWGWSCLERWTPDRSGDNSDKEQSSTVKPISANSHGGVTTKYSNPKNLSSSTPSTSSSTTKNPRKNKPTPPSIRPKTTDEITKNSEKNLRNIIARSSVSDDEGLARRHNMVPTKPAEEKNPRHIIARSSVSDDEGLASSTARLRNMVPKAGEIAKSSEKNRRNITARSSVSDDELASSTARLRNMVPTNLAGEIAKNSVKNIPARSSISDDEGLASSMARRDNMIPTKPPRSKLKAQSSSAPTKKRTEVSNDVLVQEKAPAKKRASPAPKPRRISAPPKVENNVLKAVKTPCEV